MVGTGYVQELGFQPNTTAGTTQNIGVSKTPNPKSAVFLLIRSTNGVVINSVTGSKGNTWTKDGSVINSSGSGLSVFRTQQDVAAIASGDIVTITPAASTTLVSLMVEYAGIYGVIDQSSRGLNSSSVKTLVIPAPAALIDNDEIALAFLAMGGSTSQANPTVSSAYTMRNPTTAGQHAATSDVLAIADAIPTNKAASAATFTWTTTAVNAAGAIVTYRTRSGKPKVWNGSAWVSHPAKIWNGSNWVPYNVRAYNGTAEIVAK